MTARREERKKEYRDLLRDPRWQRKRLEVMLRDDFTCVKCGDKTTELQIDHLFYTKGALPWEYPLNALQTLCRNCHETKSEMEGRIVWTAIPMPLRPVQRKPRAGACQEAFLIAYWIDSTALKERAMHRYFHGLLEAGSVERIFSRRGLREA
jgi:hypothetical protein